MDSERERKKMSKKSNTVCSTVWQSRRVFRSAFNKVNGDFSPQAPFYCKSLILACFISVIFTLFSFRFSLFSSSRLTVTALPAAAPHHFCFSMLFFFFGSLSSPATKCSCFEFTQIKQPIFFRARFHSFCLMVQLSSHTHMPYIHKQTNYITSNCQFNSFIRILQ